MDWDTMRVESFSQPDLVPLSAEAGTGRVQDSLRDLVELARGALEEGMALASGQHEAVLNKINIYTAKCLTGAGVDSFPAAQASFDRLETKAADTTVIDSASRLYLAVRHPLPYSLVMDAYSVVWAGYSLAAGFSRHALSHRVLVGQEMKQQDQAFRRFMDASAGKMSAAQAADRLKYMKEQLFLVARESCREGHRRAMEAAKHEQLQASRQAPAYSTAGLAQALAAAVSKGSKAQANPPVGQQGKRKSEQSDDVALKQFKHNGNPSQEGAARREGSEGFLAKLRALPKDKEIRAAAIKEGLCRFHWDPKFSCNRGSDCKFAHVDQTQTTMAGFTSQEIHEYLSSFKQFS